jgi:PadR family transcriptional regulator PadR
MKSSTPEPPPEKSDLLQGTLDLLVLKVLDLAPMHGYGIAQRLEQISRSVLQVNQGSLYPALLRLEQQGWIQSHWGASDNNRRAKFYSLTRAGRRQLAAETERWERMSGAIARLLRAVPG